MEDSSREGSLDPRADGRTRPVKRYARVAQNIGAIALDSVRPHAGAKGEVRPAALGHGRVVDVPNGALWLVLSVSVQRRAI